MTLHQKLPHRQLGWAKFQRFAADVLRLAPVALQPISLAEQEEIAPAPWVQLHELLRSAGCGIREPKPKHQSGHIKKGILAVRRQLEDFFKHVQRIFESV